MHPQHPREDANARGDQQEDSVSSRDQRAAHSTDRVPLIERARVKGQYHVMSSEIARLEGWRY